MCKELLTSKTAWYLRQVQDDLESEGFEVQCFHIPGTGIGAWHQRYKASDCIANTDTQDLSIGENHEKYKQNGDSITSRKTVPPSLSPTNSIGGKPITDTRREQSLEVLCQEKGSGEP